MNKRKAIQFREKRLICAELRRSLKERKVTQSAVAEALKITQPHLSKLLRDDNIGYSDAFIELCNYAKVELYDRSVYDPLEDEELKSVLRRTIGHSREKARMVTTLVEALGGLTWESR